MKSYTASISRLAVAALTALAFLAGVVRSQPSNYLIWDEETCPNYGPTYLFATLRYGEVIWYISQGDIGGSDACWCASAAMGMQAYRGHQIAPHNLREEIEEITGKSCAQRGMLLDYCEDDAEWTVAGVMAHTTGGDWIEYMHLPPPPGAPLPCGTVPRAEVNHPTAYNMMLDHLNRRLHIISIRHGEKSSSGHIVVVAGLDLRPCGCPGVWCEDAEIWTLDPLTKPLTGDPITKRAYGEIESSSFFEPDVWSNTIKSRAKVVGEGLYNAVSLLLLHRKPRGSRDNHTDTQWQHRRQARPGRYR